MKRAPRKACPEMEVRDFVSGQDDPLIFDSWTKQIAAVCPLRQWSGAAKKTHRQEVLEQLVLDCPTKVAALPGSNVVLYGWICGGLTASNGQVLHFIFTRNQWRGRGVAERLLLEVFPDFRKRDLYYTHNTRMVRLVEKDWRAFWNPYLINEELV